MNLNVRRRERERERFKNTQKMDSYSADLLRGKIEFLLSDYGVDESCKMSTSVIEKVLKALKSQGKENAIVEYKIKRGGIEKNFVLLGVNNQVIKIDLKHGLAEITNCTKTISAEEKPTEFIDLEDIAIKGRNDFLYTLDDFIFDTNIYIRSKKTLPSYRPAIVCKDGFMLSVQASRTSASKPKENNRTDYTHFEVGQVYEEIPELEPYKRKINMIGGHVMNVYEYVPKSCVEKLLEKHGGIDEAKTFTPSILCEQFNDNFGFKKRLSHLDDVLKSVKKFDELSKLDGKNKDELEK